MMDPRPTRFLSVLLTCTLVTPIVVQAQGTTGDGAAALMDGDRAAAERILRPLAQDAVRPDPLAAFFLAIASERESRASGDGRACALYLRAATPGSPVQAQALALAQDVHQDNPFLYEPCFARAQGEETPPAANQRQRVPPRSHRSRTIEGIDAMSRGAYQEAAYILKPIAEAWRRAITWRSS